MAPVPADRPLATGDVIGGPAVGGGELVPVPHTPDNDGLRPGDVDGWGRSERMRALARALYDPIYQQVVPGRVGGPRAHPREGGALLVANHAGAIPSDAPVIMHGIETELGRPVYGLADHLFRDDARRSARCGRRPGGVAAHPDNAYRLLHDEQQLVLVFPEGTKGTGQATFGERYQLRRFGRGGFVEIAMRAGVPIVPIAVVGAEESMPIVCKSARLAKLLSLPYFPVTANQLVFGPVLGLVALLAGQVPLRVLAAGALRRRARPGALLRSAGHGRVGAHPRHRSRTRSTTCCAPAAACGSADAMRSRSVTGLGDVLGRPARRPSRAIRVDVIVGLDTRRAGDAARAHRVRAQPTRSTRSSSRIVQATQVDTIVHTHLIVDSTTDSGRAAARDQRHRHDEPVRRGAAPRAARCARSS